MKQKRLIMMLAVLAAAGAAMAQGNGQAGITEATQLVTGYFDPGTKLVYAVWSLYLPDSSRHYSEVVLPLKTIQRHNLCLILK